MITGVSHITFAVSDLQRSIEFYGGILGLKLVARWDRGAYLQGGEAWIALNLESSPLQGPASGDSHVAFTIALDMITAVANDLLAAGVTVWRQPRDNHSFYFTDPDGHRLELHAGDLSDRLAEFADDPPGGFERCSGSEGAPPKQ